MANSPAYGLSNYALSVQNSTANTTVFSNSLTGSTEFTIDGFGNVTSTSNTIVGRSLVFADGSVLSTASGASAVFDYTGDGVTTAFSTGNYSATSTLNTNVFISGVYQRKNQYSWTGTTITFTQPPPAGTAIEINIQTINTVITVPAAGSVTPSVLSTGGPSWDSLGNVTVGSNLAMSGNAARIVGDFSNATYGNRLIFQTSTTNGNTGVLAMPNGSGAAAAFRVLSTSDPNNNSLGDINATSSDIRFTSGYVGTGTYLPMTFYTGGAERMRITNGGLVGINSTAPVALLNTNGGGIVVSSDGDYFGGGAYYASGNWKNSVTNEGGWVLRNTGGVFTIYTGSNAGTAGSNFSSFSEVFRVSNTGNVGINQSSPSYTLDINNQGTAGSLRILTSYNGLNYFDIFNTYTSTGYLTGGTIMRLITQNSANSGLVTVDMVKYGSGVFSINNNDTAGITTFATAGAERMRIDSSGNVMFGTTTARGILTVAQNNPAGVSSELSNLNTASNTTKYTQIQFSGYDTVSAYKPSGQITVNPADANYVGAYMAFVTRGSDTLSERMRITGGGNVGINTTGSINNFLTSVYLGNLSQTGSSQALLQNWMVFDGNNDSLELTNTRIPTTGGAGWPYSGMRLQQRVDTTYMGYIQFNNGSGTTTNNTGISFGTGSSAVGPNSVPEVMRIDSSGNMLLGTTSYFSAYSKMAIAYSGGGTQFGITLKPSADNTSALYFYNAAGTGVGSIFTSSSTTTYNTSSDYRLKENVTPMTTGLAKISALKPVNYDWISDKSKGEGFIAHELQAVVPLAVTGEKDAVNADGKPIHQGVDYSKIVVHLVAAIQELKAEFDAYKAAHP